MFWYYWRRPLLALNTGILISNRVISPIFFRLACSVLVCYFFFLLRDHQMFDREPSAGLHPLLALLLTRIELHAVLVHTDDRQTRAPLAAFWNCTYGIISIS